MDTSKGNMLLDELFLKGTATAELEGFYRGKLEQFIPGNPFEVLGGLVSRVWVPWYGKAFDKHEHRGENVVPGYLASFIRSRYGDKAVLSREGSTAHVFPFQTRIVKGLKDPIKVLQLDYDLPENPPGVRTVIDELVCVGENVYLGKAYLREKDDFRLVAFFRLEK